MKDLIRLKGEIRTPPFSQGARVEAGVLLRRLQAGESLSMPHSRPMPSIGPGCHELRIRDSDHNWRIVYHIGQEHIVILDIFKKTTEQTPDSVIQGCQRRLQRYQEAQDGDEPQA